MVKEVRNQDFEYVNEQEVRDKAYNYFVEKYKLVKDKEENKKIMENHGYIFGTKIYSRYRTGKFQKLSDIADNRKGEHREIAYEVNTHDHGIDALHSVDMIKKSGGITI